MKCLQSSRFEDKFRNDLKMNITQIYQPVCNVIREKIAPLYGKNHRHRFCIPQRKERKKDKMSLQCICVSKLG